MRKLDVSAVTSSIGLPVKSGTLSHVQLAYQEALGELGKAMAGTGYVTNKAYILNGCANSGSGSNYIISTGSLFYNGEVFLVDAATFTISGPNVAVGVIATTFFADTVADPVEFTDGVLRNIHQIRKIVLQPGLSGSGAANFLDFIDVTKRIQGGLGQITIWKYTGSLSTYFTSGLGIHPWTLGWAICDGGNGTVDMGGFVPVGYKASDTDYDTPYTDTGGAKTATLVQENLPSISLDVPVTQDDTSQTDAGPGGSGRFAMGNDGVDAPPFPTLHTEDLGTDTPFDIRQPYRAVLFVQRIA